MCKPAKPSETTRATTLTSAATIRQVVQNDRFHPAGSSLATVDKPLCSLSLSLSLSRERENDNRVYTDLLDHAVSGDHLDRRSNSGDAHEHRAEEVVVSRARAKANEDRAKDERGEAQVGHLRVGLLQNKALVRHDNGRDGGLDGHLEGNTDQVERPVCEAHVEGREEGDLGEPAEVVHREHSELGLASHEDKGASDHGREAREEREGDRVVERVAAEAHLGKESLSDHRASVHEHRSAREERLAHHVDGCHGLGHGAGQRVGTGER
mmetsp:Transcript_27449/g.74566  ORF Transcript_27449/g.74566 Transcript_27449/m.74566 type:complete len:267 (-) Transcript_27449:17-817(-)